MLEGKYEQGAWYLKQYQCTECGETWEDEWDCLCDDRCPSCGAAMEPQSWEEVKRECTS